jgi:hypothetical protein
MMPNIEYKLKPAAGPVHSDMRDEEQKMMKQGWQPQGTWFQGKDIGIPATDPLHFWMFQMMKKPKT